MYPNLFLVGSPKAGTTSFASYLSQHPDVFCSVPKEPFHHCTDFPDLVAQHGFGSVADYERLFFDAEEPIRMDASTAYLQSRVAIGSIEAATEQAARYVVMLREPASLIVSFHRTQTIAFNEDLPDVRSAWDAQEARRSGDLEPPSTCINPMFLQYRDVASQGKHVARLLDTVDRERVRFILFDDFQADAASVVAGAAEWLGLCGFEFRASEVLNPGTKQHRSSAVSRFLQRPPSALLPVTRGVRNWMRRPSNSRLQTIVRSIVWAPAPRSSIDDSLRAEIRRDLAGDVALLEELTKIDLSRWPR